MSAQVPEAVARQIRDITQVVPGVPIHVRYEHSVAVGCGGGEPFEVVLDPEIVNPETRCDQSALEDEQPDGMAVGTQPTDSQRRPRAAYINHLKTPIDDLPAERREGSWPPGRERYRSDHRRHRRARSSRVFKNTSGVDVYSKLHQ
ncbi:hypothetical protein [Streptomyces sp. col6]|uniref:hypothetical protein n=1 Tax=Streptomyces sp. col6 TaxID=2478958 RepID=UPI001747776A|nr:hypothetical protein [Streptomyces sp. col6]